MEDIDHAKERLDLFHRYFWLVVWNIFFPIYWEFYNPNWLSYFSEGLKPPTSIWVPSAHSAAWQAFFCCKNVCVGCYFLVYICQCGGCCIVKRSVLQPVDVRRAAFFFGLQKMIEMLQPSWVLLALPVFFRGKGEWHFLPASFSMCA